MADKFGIVIHGGAGTILKMSLTDELEQEYKDKLAESLQVGYDILNDGGSSLEATQAAIIVMENSPLFNAGKGAVFTHDGTNEQDASIMCGKTLNCGAVAGVRHVKNPIKLARLVMDKSEHVLLCGDGAETFGKIYDIETVGADYFYTDQRWQQLQKVKEKERRTKTNVTQLDHSVDSDNQDDSKHGTVGAVALDKDGNLAASTSSGGMTNKKFGRIGDSSQIGAGNYANNATCAVSTTGHGEYFMRCVSAYDLSALMEYKGLSLEDASYEVIQNKLKLLGGSGGLIAIDYDCNFVLPFNTRGMYRGHFMSNGEVVVKIFND